MQQDEWCYERDDSRTQQGIYLTKMRHASGREWHVELHAGWLNKDGKDSLVVTRVK